MELKGAKRVTIAGISDKRQITAVLRGTMAGDFLPPQLIYQGKTTACNPRYKFPDNWSNEEMMIEYIKKKMYSICAAKRNELKLSPEQAALAPFDVFRGQQTERVSALLEENNIIVMPIPPNCTDRLQQMDLSVNKAVKEFMRSRFREWYANEVQKQLDDGVQQITPVDLKMSTMKSLGARWLVSLHDHINENNSFILNSFKATGIL